MVGRMYLLRGEPVEVLARWRNAPRHAVTYGVVSVTPPNVLLKLPNGQLTVRPFRGLRRLPSDAASTVALARPGKSLGRNSALGEVRPSSVSREVSTDV